MNREWLEHAACIGAPDAVFFPPIGGNNTSAPAKAICAGCPVRLACLAACMETEANFGHCRRHGIYAGLTPDERARLARSA